VSGTENELETLRAERARLTEDRERRTAARTEAAELARLKREIADEEAILKAEADHGPTGTEIAVVPSACGQGIVILKRPTHASYRQMIDAVGAGKMALSAINERFVFQCLAYPERGAFESILKSESGMLERAANAAAKLGGLVVEELSGK
jgi:hypothetical protein